MHKNVSPHFNTERLQTKLNPRNIENELLRVNIQLHKINGQ